MYMTIYMTVFTITSNAGSCINCLESNPSVTMYNNIYIDKYSFHCKSIYTRYYKALYPISIIII